jgi:hypothetical protein
MHDEVVIPDLLAAHHHILGLCVGVVAAVQHVDGVVACAVEGYVHVCGGCGVEAAVEVCNGDCETFVIAFLEGVTAIVWV